MLFYHSGGREGGAGCLVSCVALIPHSLLGLSLEFPWLWGCNINFPPSTTPIPGRFMERYNSCVHMSFLWSWSLEMLMWSWVRLLQARIWPQILITFGYQKGMLDFSRGGGSSPWSTIKQMNQNQTPTLKHFTHQQAIHFSLVYILFLIRQKQWSDQLFDWTRKKTKHSQFTSCLWFCAEISLFESHVCLWFQRRFSCLPHFFSFPILSLLSSLSLWYFLCWGVIQNSEKFNGLESWVFMLGSYWLMVLEEPV